MSDSFVKMSTSNGLYKSNDYYLQVVAIEHYQPFKADTATRRQDQTQIGFGASRLAYSPIFTFHQLSSNNC